MVLDYRNTRFSFNQLRKRRRRQHLRWAAALLSLAGVTLLILHGVQHREFRRVQEDLLAGKPAAETVLQTESRALFTAGAMRELRALSHLLEGRIEIGRQELSGHRHAKAVASRRFLDRMVDLGRYDSLGLYLDFLRQQGSSNTYHRLLFLTARYRPGEARGLAEDLSPAFREKHAKALRILEEIWKELEKGRIACIHDHSGQVVAEYEPATATIHSRVSGMDLSPFKSVLQQGLRFFTLTLDARLQGKVHAAFSNYHGSCVILNPKDNAILAAYSKPQEPQSGNAAWKQRYEPGSIIKSLTYLAFSQASDQHLFPLQCRGNTTIEGRIFYDWTRHGKVDSPETALVVSCNIAYARMGLAVGDDKLAQILRQFKFNSPPLRDRCLTFELGDFNPPPLPPRRLADLSVGLEEIRITTLHGALLAAAFSQSGSLSSPYLIATEKNILKLGIYHHQPQALASIPGGRIFARLRNAMVRVIRDAEGTGHRALLPSGPVTAAKTGTAGNPALGLDAVMIGFLPAQRPLFAFAFRLEHGGKAETHGAAVLKALLLDALSIGE